MIELTLTFISGSRRGVETFNTLPLTLGRADDCQIRFDPDKDLKVSAHHAELRSDGEGGVEIADLESKNGVSVNGAKVTGVANVPNLAVVELGPEGPRFKVKIEVGAGAGGFSFKAKPPAAQPIPGARSLKTTDESRAYTEAELESTQPAIPRKSGTSPLVLVVAVLALLGAAGAAVYALMFRPE